MPLFVYNRDIPDGPNNPSVDQPDMKVNTNSVDDLINVDHYAFNDANGGLHKQVNFVNEASPAILGNSVIYSAINNAQSVPFIKNAVIDQPLISGVGVGLGAIGYTSLLGGVIIQWGFVNGTHDGANQRFANNDQGSVVFPITFPGTVIGVQTTVGYLDNPPITNPAIVSVRSNSVTTSGFPWTFLINQGGNSVFNRFYWWAIGF